jgi:hypothetical protein
MQPFDRNIHKFFSIETLIHTNTFSIKLLYIITWKQFNYHKTNAMHACHSSCLFIFVVLFVVLRLPKGIEPRSCSFAKGNWTPVLFVCQGNWTPVLFVCLRELNPGLVRLPRELNSGLICLPREFNPSLVRFIHNPHAQILYI